MNLVSSALGVFGISLLWFSLVPWVFIHPADFKVSVAFFVGILVLGLVLFWEAIK